MGKTQTWSVAKFQRKHTAQGIQSIHPFINPPILLAITLTSQEVTIQKRSINTNVVHTGDMNLGNILLMNSPKNKT
jgi:hypothetical protein